MAEQNNYNGEKPLVSIVIPGYNEEAIVTQNLTRICDYMSSLSEDFDWKLIFINDGSCDKTGELADELAKNKSKLLVKHHFVNMNLGNALKTGFAHAKGDYIITLDIDLSYAPYHIANLLKNLENTKADIVIASPYMKGGKVTKVPFMRRVMSRLVNRFMRVAAQEKLYTYTGMVRGYRTDFLKRLNLKAKDYEINPEILYKAMILRARIIEIPAHLDWTEQNKLGVKRKSGMRLINSFYKGLMAGFVFRPYIYFLGLGIILFFLSLYIIGWIFYNTFQIYQDFQIDPQAYLGDLISVAIGKAYSAKPYAFFVGGITLLAALQMLSLGFISLQNKRYFEESFHICTSILNESKSRKSNH